MISLALERGDQHRSANKMRYKKILFCLPPVTAGRPRSPFTGVGYLSTFLAAHQIDNAVIDMNLGYSEKALFRAIDYYQPDLVGFFLMTHAHQNSYRLMQSIKEHFHVPIVAGGPHASMLRKRILEDSLADFAVKLEGEETLLELMQGRDVNSIKGLIYRTDGGIVETEDRSFIEDLDAIPFPTYEKFQLNRYTGNCIPIISSRGCPYSCIYCPVKAAIGRRFRTRSPENILQEVKYWYSRGFRVFEFMDDNFTLKKERVARLCELLLATEMKDLVLHCPNGIRADAVDRELLTLMKRTGFKVLSFGVEGGNDRILKNLKKGSTIAEMERAIKDACELGFDVTLFFLVGSPGETMADVEDSIRLALKYPVNNAFFYSLIPYPETELYEWVTKNDYFTELPERYLSGASANKDMTFFATPEFSLSDRKLALQRARQAQKLIKRESIRRRFFNNSPLATIPSAVLANDFVQKRLVGLGIFWKLYNKYLSTASGRSR